jgi:hypothetical protein
MCPDIPVGFEYTVVSEAAFGISAFVTLCYLGM